MSKDAPASTVQHKGVSYSLVSDAPVLASVPKLNRLAYNAYHGAAEMVQLLQDVAKRDLAQALGGMLSVDQDAKLRDLWLAAKRAWVDLGDDLLLLKDSLATPVGASVKTAEDYHSEREIADAGSVAEEALRWLDDAKFIAQGRSMQELMGLIASGVALPPAPAPYRDNKPIVQWTNLVGKYEHALDAFASFRTLLEDLATGEDYVMQHAASTVQHKGATYELVELAKPRIQYKGATYRLISAEQLPEDVQNFLRSRGRDKALDEMLSDIQHVTPHRRKSYDPSKVRMRGDEEQEQLEKLQVDVSRMESEQPRETEKIDTHISPEDVEVIEFGTEQPAPYRESTDEPSPAQDYGPSTEDDLHVRVPEEDLSFLASVPGIKRDSDAATFLNKAMKGQGTPRNEVWASEHQLVAVVTALHDLVSGGDVGDEVQTQARALIHKYKQLFDAPASPRSKGPSYESKPREEGRIRMFSYRGATIRRRVRP